MADVAMSLSGTLLIYKIKGEEHLKRYYFCPDDFVLTPDIEQWAMQTFKVDKKEVYRQLELMRDHEFLRPYSSWDRVFRNWMRKAEDFQTLRRERQYRRPEELSEAQREADAKKAWAELNRLRSVK